MAYVMRKQVTVKLPEALVAFIGDKAAEAHITRTDVFIDAISCLRQRDIETLMAEGYEEMAHANAEFAEGALGAMREVLPDE